MQDRLTHAALSGTKVATGALLEQEYLDENELVESPGERQVLLGGGEAVAAIIEITRVETHRFIDVPWEFADDEGEGFTSIEQWREGHRSYYATEGIVVSDDSIFVCVWFRILHEASMELLRSVTPGSGAPPPDSGDGHPPEQD
jgi:uncharacterized protein YhfF